MTTQDKAKAEETRTSAPVFGFGANYRPFSDANDGQKVLAPNRAAAGIIEAAKKAEQEQKQNAEQSPLVSLPAINKKA